MKQIHTGIYYHKVRFLHTFYLQNKHFINKLLIQKSMVCNICYHGPFCLVRYVHGSVCPDTDLNVLCVLIILLGVRQAKYLLNINVVKQSVSKSL